MMCKTCTLMADMKLPGWTHTTTEKPEAGPNWLDSLFWTVREDAGGACRGETHCFCQHKDPGTAINKEVASSDLAKRINEGLPIV